MASTTKERLLRVAAKHFAAHGYAATSVRSIVGDAKANVAAVNYHFGSKQDLFLETLRVPMEQLARERLEALTAVMNSDDKSARRIAEAFVLPIKNTRWPGGMVPLCKMLMRSFNEEPELKSRVYELYCTPTRMHFTHALHRLVPQASTTSVEVAFHFLISCVVGSISCCENFPDPSGTRDKHDLHYLEELVAFSTAGLTHTLGID